jgi:hypothetical protein
MNFSLDGGWMLAIVVLLWVLVYVPNWGKQQDEKNEGSSSGGKFSRISKFEGKNAPNGVSQIKNSERNIRAVRRFFTALLVVSFVTVVYAAVQTFENFSFIALTVVAAALFLISASTLRSSRKKAVQRTPLTMQELEAQRARMAYSIREAALRDAPREQLFDERAWTENALPESNLSRRIGELEEVKLASVSNLDLAQSAGDEKKLKAQDLDRILERRRAV